MASLLLFPLNFLKSFGYAGVAVISLAVVGALIPLPALLAILGHKVDKGVVYVDISDKLLFKTGSYDVTERAKVVLGKVAKVLALHHLRQPDFL